MAEQIPYGVATTLIDRLASAAFREFGRIYGVEDELERLKNTVESIKAVLLDAEEKQDQSHAVQLWVRRLKDVLLSADDLIDEFLIEDMIHERDKAHKNKVTQVFHYLSPKKIDFRLKMAREIETLQKNFNDVVKVIPGLNPIPNVLVVEKTNDVSRETSSFVLESEIIGREDDKKKIISLLRQSHENQNVSLVAIVGIGGLGKTALAQLVYNDAEVTKLFQKTMWVSVSDNFDVKTILKNILESLTNMEVGDTLTLQTLQNRLRDNLTGKRYLLLLDDVWNKNSDKWDKLRTYLMCGDQGSKIVVTTRSKTVAETMGVSDPYVLNGLTPEESWHLLKTIITYGNKTRGVNQTLESIGEKIAEKCKGVPLAIRSLGGILRRKREEREWIDVLQGDFWKLCKEEGSIMPVLKLSYRNLSPEQRQCFAYCSLFPQDWTFNKDELIQMWMAQGYLGCPVEEQCLENVGNQFVHFFLMNSFFQDATMNSDGDIEHFKMHDLMHDLATQVAGNDCCFLDSRAKRCPQRLVHVSVEVDTLHMLKSLDSSRLRTLIVFDYNGNKMDEEEPLVISNFKYLRVLNSKLRGYVKMLVGSIEKMKHLRHLNLVQCNGLKIHPKSIGNLVCLQTLKLSGNVGLSGKHISKLICLRHLQIDCMTFEDETPAGSKKLSIQQHKGLTLSNWISPLTNIIEISLLDCNGFQYLPPLERLPFLKSLFLNMLWELEYIYYKVPIRHESFFPSLESLTVWRCTKLKGWRRIGDDLNDTNSSDHLLLPHFPCLSKLNILFCYMLTLMPTFPNIKRLELAGCNLEILKATLNIAESQYSNAFTPPSMLKYLEILYFGNLSSEQFQVIETCFKDDLNCLPSLQKIKFSSCDDLKALPDWICNISSLQHIEVIGCSGDLADLPEGMPRLTNLHTLEIKPCPLLIEECQRETSATWSKIAHIPSIIFSKSRWDIPYQMVKSSHPKHY